MKQEERGKSPLYWRATVRLITRGKWLVAPLIQIRPSVLCLVNHRSGRKASWIREECGEHCIRISKNGVGLLHFMGPERVEGWGWKRLKIQFRSLKRQTGPTSAPKGAFYIQKLMEICRSEPVDVLTFTFMKMLKNDSLSINISLAFDSMRNICNNTRKG